MPESPTESLLPSLFTIQSTIPTYCSLSVVPPSGAPSPIFLPSFDVYQLHRKPALLVLELAHYNLLSPGTICAASHQLRHLGTLSPRTVIRINQRLLSVRNPQQRQPKSLDVQPRAKSQPFKSRIFIQAIPTLIHRCPFVNDPSSKSLVKFVSVSRSPRTQRPTLSLLLLPIVQIPILIQHPSLCPL